MVDVIDAGDGRKILWSGNYRTLNKMFFYITSFHGYKVHSMGLVAVPVMGSLLETETTITARLRTRLIQINIDLGMAEWSRSTVTDGLAAVDEEDRLVRDEFHRTERVGLQLHGGLFEARARLTRWARLLVRRPCCRAIRRLGNDGGDWLGLCGHC